MKNWQRYDKSSVIARSVLCDETISIVLKKEELVLMKSARKDNWLTDTVTLIWGSGGY
jgi:hypothetical protein